MKKHLCSIHSFLMTNLHSSCRFHSRVYVFLKYAMRKIAFRENPFDCNPTAHGIRAVSIVERSKALHADCSLLRTLAKVPGRNPV